MIRDGLTQIEIIRAALQNHDGAKEVLSDLLTALQTEAFTAELQDKLTQALET